MNAQKYYIATVAELGAGKGLFTQLTQKLCGGRRIASVVFSDPLKDIIEIADKPVTRTNFQAVGTALRKAFQDEGWLAGAVKKRLTMVDDANIIILDGIRKPEEVRLIRELTGVLVYITADLMIRFSRRRESSEKTDEKGMTWEQFQEQDLAPTETSIRMIGDTMADIRLENNGTIPEFEEKVKEFLKKYVPICGI